MNDVFVCEFCNRKYQTEQKLHDHKMANHWKKLYPNKRGKPG